MSSPSHPGREGGREGFLFPLCRRGHQGSASFRHLLWPGARSFCAPSSQTWERGRHPAIQRAGLLPAHTPSSYHTPRVPWRSCPPGWLDTPLWCFSGCFYPQPSGSTGPACGLALWPPYGLLLWGPEAQLAKPNGAGTSLGPSPTSSPRIYQHLSLMGFKISISALLLHKIHPYKGYILWVLVYSVLCNHHH